MHTEMWEHPAVQTNLMTLRAYGCTIVDPETGFLAGGDEGIGRLAEPDTIVQVRAGTIAPAVGNSVASLCRALVGAHGAAIDEARLTHLEAVIRQVEQVLGERR